MGSPGLQVLVVSSVFETVRCGLLNATMRKVDDVVANAHLNAPIDIFTAILAAASALIPA